MADKLTVLKGRTFFLGVGAQKAGTTWLSFYLRDHPEIFMSPIKEMHFFGNRETSDYWPTSMFRKKLAEREAAQAKSGGNETKNFVALRERVRMGGDVKRYRRFFRKRVEHEQVYGEITPAYSFLTQEEFKFVRENFPSTRIIFLLRNPVDRMWSQMRFSEKFETLEELEGRIDTVFKKPVYYERFDYVQTIRNLRATFPHNRLHFEFYERLFTPEAVNGICRFLDVSPHPAKFERARNVSIKMPLSPSLRLKMAQRLADQYTFVRDIFGGDIPMSWETDLDSLREH